MSERYGFSHDIATKNRPAPAEGLILQYMAQTSKMYLQRSRSSGIFRAFALYVILFNTFEVSRLERLLTVG